ncbi:MAG TPA: SIS domain-containing protein [Candidatus Limnocylindrales bacterium]|nr:SIS domain-containing protein [Candidatus Limnocylindrales bacterium]
MTFDPEGVLPGAPDPWASSSLPAWRDAPPYAMTEMIAAEPALAERLVRRLSVDPSAAALADAVRTAAQAGDAIVLTGCGTSEHAAMIGAALLDDALRAAGVADGRVASVQAFELLGRPQTAGLVIAVSHEGGTWATNQAVSGARDAGARTALVTVSGRSPGAQLAQLVIETTEQDQSWCHSVGYLSPIVVAATVGSLVRGAPLDAVAVRALLDSSDHVAAAEGMAAALRSCQRLLIVGSGLDHATARELALKIEEGAHLPATALQLETIRHGHLASADERTGLVLVLTDAEARGALVVERATAVLRSAAAIGMPAAAVIAADLGDDVAVELTPAGRAAVPLTTHLPRAAAAALGTAIPIQLLAERLARARGTNPDTIGREDPRQAAAADA